MVVYVNVDQLWVDFDVGNFGIGSSFDVVGDLYFFDIEVDQLVFVDFVVGIDLQGIVDVVVVQLQVVGQIYVGDVGVVDIGIDVGVEDCFRYEVVLQQQGWWQVFEGIDFVVVQVYVLFLWIGQYQFGGDVWGEEVVDVEFWNYFFVDGDVV